MTNSIFVSRDDTFKITVYYTKDDDFSVKKKDDLTQEEIDSGDYLSLTITFSLPDHATSKMIMRRSTNVVNGTPSFDQGTFNNLLFELLSTSWDLKDENEKSVDFDGVKINEMRPDIVRIFIDLLQEELDGRGLYIAVLQS